MGVDMGRTTNWVAAPLLLLLLLLLEAGAGLLTTALTLSA